MMRNDNNDDKDIDFDNDDNDYSNDNDDDINNDQIRIRNRNRNALIALGYVFFHGLNPVVFYPYQSGYFSWLNNLSTQPNGP